MAKLAARRSSGRLPDLEVEGRLKFWLGPHPHASRVSREGGIVCRVSVSESAFKIK
jgi:hypothetical protein